MTLTIRSTHALKQLKQDNTKPVVVVTIVWVVVVTVGGSAITRIVVPRTTAQGAIDRSLL